MVTSKSDNPRMQLAVLAYTFRTLSLISWFPMKKFLVAVLDLFDCVGIIIRGHRHVPTIDESCPGMERIGVHGNVISPTITSDTFY